jgi:hypothetical protein
MSNVYRPDSRRRMRLILETCTNPPRFIFFLNGEPSSFPSLVVEKVPLKSLTKPKTNEQATAKKIKRRQVLLGISLSIQMPTVKTFGNSLEMPMVKTLVISLKCEWLKPF